MKLSTLSPVALAYGAFLAFVGPARAATAPGLTPPPVQSPSPALLSRVPLCGDFDGESSPLPGDVDAPGSALPTFTYEGRALPPEGRPRVGPMERPPDGFYQTSEQVTPWLRQVAALQPYRSSLIEVGRSTQGRPILGLQVLPPTGDPAKWHRLAVICRQHGNEPEATASGTRFVYQWFAAKLPQQKSIAENTALLFVPVCNPDGAAHYQRHTAANVDMNRDWGKLRSPEVRALTRQITAFKPQMVIDVHQWLPAEHQEPSMAEASGGVLAQRAAWAMAWSNAQRGYYLSARSHYGLATLCHRFFGQCRGTPAILLESRHRPGVPGARDLALVQTVTALWGGAAIVAQ